jgi:DNA helicase-2/ATP-dependent DNA helicase PcrA
VTHRIAYAVRTGVVDPGEVLAVTHSRRAAAELADRLGGLGVRLHRRGVAGAEVRTFHAAGLRVAARFWARTGRGGDAPEVIADRAAWGLWREVLRARAGGEVDPAVAREVVEEVGWARSQLLATDGYESAVAAAGRHPGVAVEMVADAWARFEAAKRRRGVVDFADLLEIAAALLEGDEPVGRLVRRRWRYVTVDEYQDTDPAQQRLLEAILGDGRELCVVGDPRQAIYGWKGADPRYLNEFAAKRPGAKVFHLTRNYRSTPQIVEWGNRVAADGPGRPLVATQPAGPAPRVWRLESEAEEAAWAARRAREAIDAGVAASQIAVLYRYNATQGRLEAAFADAGVAAAAAGEDTFFDRPEVAQVKAAIATAARTDPSAAARDVLASALHEAGFDHEMPPEGQGPARARWESLAAFAELLGAWSGIDDADARALSGHLEDLAERTHETRGGGVTLASLHRAKGLEWDVVMIVGVHDGAIPASYATGDDQLAEEERLLHVGVTRARRELYLTWAAVGGRVRPNKPSPYLELLSPPARRPGRRSPRTASPARDLGSGRAEGASGGGCALCTEPLKGLGARHLGICATCVQRAPGAVGRRARRVVDVADRAASELHLPRTSLVSDAGLLRLLDQRPVSADAVAHTAGVDLAGRWAAEIAEVLVAD